MAGASTTAKPSGGTMTFDAALRRIENAGVRPDSDDWKRFHRVFSDKVRLSPSDVDMFLHQ